LIPRPPSATSRLLRDTLLRSIIQSKLCFSDKASYLLGSDFPFTSTPQGLPRCTCHNGQTAPMRYTLSFLIITSQSRARHHDPHVREHRVLTSRPQHETRQLCLPQFITICTAFPFELLIRLNVKLPYIAFLVLTNIITHLVSCT
jgi:hypothetical protein